MKPHPFILTGIFVFAATPYIPAADGTWTQLTAGGLWSDTANWSGGIVADGSGATADFSTLNIVSTTTVHLNSSRTIGNLTFGDAVPTGNYERWILDDNGAPANVLTFGGSAPTITVAQKFSAAIISATIAGTAGFSKAGPGWLTLEGSNTFTGTITVNGGGLYGCGSAAFGNNAAVVVSDVAGVWLDLDGDFRIGSLTGGGASGGDITLWSDSLTIGGNNSSPAPYSGRIYPGCGGGRLIKIGSGTLTLAGDNYYDSSTVINGGVLKINPTGAINSTSDVAIAGGTFDYSSTTALNAPVVFSGTGNTLRGIGTISQPVSVTAGNVLSPGSGGVGEMTIAAVTLRDHSTFKVEINTSGTPSIDLLNVTGSLNLEPSAILDISDVGADVPLAPGTTLTFLDYGGTWNGGTFDGHPDDSVFSLGSNQFQISYNGPGGIDTAVTLTAVVPEPASVALLSFGTLLLAVRRRRGTQPCAGG